MRCAIDLPPRGALWAMYTLTAKKSINRQFTSNYHDPTLSQHVSLGMRSISSYKVKAFSSTDERVVLFPVTGSITSMGVDCIPPVTSRNAWVEGTSQDPHRCKAPVKSVFDFLLSCVSVLIAQSGGMGVKVSKYPEFLGFESSCLVTSLHQSTEGSAKVVVRPDKDDFSYWRFVSGWL
nr:hypothetical transcript [Hymenolepis microstoma]